jgi:hypothetical protein
VGRSPFLALFLVGCAAAPSEDPPAASDEPVVDAPAVEHEAPPLRRGRTFSRAGVDEPICTLLPLTSADIPITRVAADLQDATGGDILPGTYDLTADIEYTGTGGAVGTAAQAFAQTIRISGDSLVSHTRERGIGSNGSGRWGVNGTTLATFEQCPESGHFQMFHYTATPTTIELHIGGHEVLVYTLR